MADVPPKLVVTVTSTVPGVSVAGDVAVIVCGSTTTTFVADVRPNFTMAPLLKLVPPIVTDVPPEVGPVFGLTLVTVGAATYVNRSLVPVADVPPVVVTVTSTTPTPAGAVAVIDVAEFTVTFVAALRPN